MSLQHTTEPTVDTDVELTPRQQQELRVAFQRYQRLKGELENTQSKLDTAKADLAVIRTRIGEVTISVDGFRSTLVWPVRSKLDKKKLLRLGVTQAQIEQATTTKPGRPYELVTCPGDKRRSQEDDE